MIEFTKSEKQLVVNAVNLNTTKGRKSPSRLSAFINNDTDFIAAFDAKAKSFNSRSEREGWPLTAYFNEQISWDIEAFKGVKEIREFEA